jgi:hypothetical protein
VWIARRMIPLLVAICSSLIVPVKSLMMCVLVGAGGWSGFDSKYVVYACCSRESASCQTTLRV